MHQMDQKRLLIERIVPYFTGAPHDVVQRLLQTSVSTWSRFLMTQSRRRHGRRRLSK